jgi:outer membrane protein TolC
LLLAAGGAWVQAEDGREEIIQRMLRIVLDNNPTLASQQTLLRESEKLPELRTGVVVTGMSLSLATGFWDPDTRSFRLFPAATLGTNLSIGDPARALNAYALKKEREGARQEYRKIKNSLVADLLATVREILKLAGRRESLEKLKTYLQDYSDLIEKQVRAGVAPPEVDKLWDLKERLLGIEAEVGDVENQLDTMQLEAALRLAGDSWQELLELLTRLGGK